MSIKNRFLVAKARAEQFLAPRPNLRSILMCALIVFAVFPDVFLSGTSISMLDKLRVPLQGRDHRSIYPEKSTTLPEDGLYDSDGAALQSEPMIQFLKHSIFSFQSPFWNPYSGAGSVGPETMVDIKFSPISVLVALLGGSNLAFHLVSFLVFIFALFFLSLVCTRYWGLSNTGALAVGFAFLLNGYATANLSSNTNQVYYYFPFALYAAMRFSRSTNVSNYLLLVGAYVLPLMVSFFPTTVLMLTTVSVFAAASAIQARASMKDRAQLIVVHATAALAAVALLAFTYLPLVETLKHTGAVEHYGLRPFYKANWLSILSLFSAKTFFESYAAIDPKLGPFMTNIIFHFGIVVGMVAALAVFSRRALKDLMLAVAVAMLAISLGRVFGLPGLSQVIDHVPFFRNLGEQYWWMMIGCCFPVVFAHGVRALELSEYRLWPAVVIAVIFLADLIYVWQFYGFPADAPIHFQRAVYYVVRAVFMVAATIYCLRLFKLQPQRRQKLIQLLAFAVFFELIFYANSTRVTRTDLFGTPPDYIQFVKKNIGLQRIANFGAYGLPAEVGSGFQIQQLEFFGMNMVPAYSDLCQRGITNQHGWQGQGFCANRDPQLDPNVNRSLLDMLSVRYIVVSKYMPKFVKFFDDEKFPRVFENVNITVFENPTAFPRVYGVNRLIEAPLTPETKQISATSAAFTDDPKFVDEARSKGVLMGEEASTPQAAATDFNHVRIREYGNTNVRLEADFEKPGVMILPDNWHPNWSAKVNGEPAYIGRVNQTFRGIALAPGKHTIEFNYRPKTLSLGLWIGGVTLALLALLFVFRRAIESKLPDSLSED